jgi:hypothetical protein
MQPRCSPRTHVRYQASVQTDNHVGEGTLFDLSSTGCRIQSTISLVPGNYLALSIEAPEVDNPLGIEVSIVRWSKDDQVGIEFLRYAHGDRERVTNLVEHLTITAAAAQHQEEEELTLSAVAA